MLYPFGYTGHTPVQLAAAACELGALVIDTRFAPRSRHPRWNADMLREALTCPNDTRPHYLSVPEFGNVNYKSGEAIRIANYDAGLRRVRALYVGFQEIEFGQEADIYPHFILLCACKDAAICHRTEIAERLARDLNTSFAELDTVWNFAKPTKPRTLVTVSEVKALRLLASVTYTVGSGHKRFARDMREATELTVAQRELLYKMVFRYRRQLGLDESAARAYVNTMRAESGQSTPISSAGVDYAALSRGMLKNPITQVSAASQLEMKI